MPRISLVLTRPEWFQLSPLLIATYEIGFMHEFKHNQLQLLFGVTFECMNQIRGSNLINSNVILGPALHINPRVSPT